MQSFTEEYIDTKSNRADDESRGTIAESEWMIFSRSTEELADDLYVNHEPLSFSVKFSEAYASFVVIVERSSSSFKLLMFSPCPSVLKEDY